MFDLAQDDGCGRRPDERAGVLVVFSHIGANRGDKGQDTVEGAAPDSFARDNENYFLLCYAEKEKALGFSICTITGQELKKQKFNLQEGKNKIAVDVLDLPTGLYLLNTKTVEGNKTFKLMVY